MSEQHGTYLYHFADKIPVKETWRIQKGKDGSRVIISERRSELFDICIMMHATERIEQSDYKFTFRKLSKDGVIAQGHYRLTNDTIAFRKTADMDWKEEPLQGRVFSPLMRIFTGPLLKTIAARGGETSVVVPFIVNPEDTEQLFSPTVSDRKVWEDKLVENKYRYLGGHYTSPVDVWVDPSGILQRYIWRPETGPIWDCRLER